MPKNTGKLPWGPTAARRADPPALTRVGLAGVSCSIGDGATGAGAEAEGLQRADQSARAQALGRVGRSPSTLGQAWPRRRCGGTDCRAQLRPSG